MSARPRDYLHGDRDCEGFYYCKRCDAFMPAAHFADGSHRMTEEDHLHYLASCAVGHGGKNAVLESDKRLRAWKASGPVLRRRPWKVKWK